MTGYFSSELYLAEKTLNPMIRAGIESIVFPSSCSFQGTTSRLTVQPRRTMDLLLEKRRRSAGEVSNSDPDLEEVFVDANDISIQRLRIFCRPFPEYKALYHRTIYFRVATLVIAFVPTFFFPPARHRQSMGAFISV